MGGREGCIDTAVKTAEVCGGVGWVGIVWMIGGLGFSLRTHIYTRLIHRQHTPSTKPQPPKTRQVGYIQRRLVKFMESVQAKYDRSVRTVKGSVIQFLYGEDGMDAVWIEKQPLRHLDLGRKQFEQRYVLDVLDDAFGQVPGRPGEYFLTEKVRGACRRDAATATLLQEELSQLLADRAKLAEVLTARPRGKETDTYLPVNLERLITTARRNERITDRSQSDLDPKEVIAAVRELCAKCVVVPGTDGFSVEAQENATIMFHIMLRATFAAKRVLLEFRLTRNALKFIVGQVETSFLQAQVAPGEMVGVQAAQSIGQPATQVGMWDCGGLGWGYGGVGLGVWAVVGFWKWGWWVGWWSRG